MRKTISKNAQEFLNFVRYRMSSLSRIPNMKNVSTLKKSTIDSPKTPGGISKSLLTPCRRVGLSRNFRKIGSSPFQSPLSSNTEVKQVKIETRKRKESLEETSQTLENVEDCGTPEVVLTPTMNVALPRRKKSKILLTSLNKHSEENESKTPTNASDKVEDTTDKTRCKEQDADNFVQNPLNTTVSTPVRTKSLCVKSRSKNKITASKETTVVELEKENFSSNQTSVDIKNENPKSKLEETKEKSPNNLTKECIVVIQKKIFKNELKEKQKSQKFKENSKDKPKSKDAISQRLYDSDSDDVPLICLNKEIANESVALKNNEDDAFETNKDKPDNTKFDKTETARSLISTKNQNTYKVNLNLKVHKPPNSQSSVDDEDDDFFEKKRTILIKKTYDKVMKPQKAKSTGSITQKDIDDLKARIATKKKMLLARAMTEDTKELKDLVKKWQKGCQDALMELMDLMKNKFPDKKNMDYSEILQTLKIPASIVGYDSDNDCFLTPDDETIILASLKE